VGATYNSPVRQSYAPFVLLASLLASSVSGFCQNASSGSWAVTAQSRYQVAANVTYQVQNGYENKLDIYSRRDATAPQPTLFYIHGGGWTGGTKEAAFMSVVPWLEMGWSVVNVEYRLAKISHAPAAVEDCLCALRWTVAHAAEYHLDPARIVASGDSAGGHLALMMGFTPDAAGLDRECPPNDPKVGLPKVAAVVNWYGITDVVDLLDGPNRKTYAVTWLGSAPNREEIAKRVSPLTYVRPGLPPVLTIQGDADPTVPYSHSLRLQEALKKASVETELITIPGGKHGMFTPTERIRIYDGIRAFLDRHGLPSHLP
jgi:acetyl esterase/lipase